MPQAPRFHLDECLCVGIAKGLRLRGRDCTTSKDTELLSSTDLQQWEFSKRERRVLITVDQDFLRMAATDSNHPGIIYWTKSAGKQFGHLVKQIDELCFQNTADDFHGKVEYL